MHVQSCCLLINQLFFEVVVAVFVVATLTLPVFTLDDSIFREPRRTLKVFFSLVMPVRL